MELTAGVRLGPYEILAPLGAGGMGEVYRAKDTRLDRLVALKVLPRHLSADAALRQRLEQEARAVAALDHPNICTLYDVGRDTPSRVSGVDAGEMVFLVMELIEGESLADRLARGPLPIEQVLRFGAEIADALAAAHRRGVVHRDLKPGNVMLSKTGGRSTGSGQAKLLDFGLAKTMPPETRAGETTTRAQALTEAGTILGTWQYMAPEQLEGREADERTDIFAFGAVLYEMITGRKAFESRSHAGLIAAILEKEPSSILTATGAGRAVSARASDAAQMGDAGLPRAQEVASAPLRALDRIIRTALAKDPDHRWQSAHDIAVQLRWLVSAGEPDESAVSAVARVSARRARERIAWTGFAVSGLAAIALWLLPRPSPPAPDLRRFAIQPPVGTVFGPGSAGTAPFPAVSPDGRLLAFVAQRPQQSPSLWVRPLDALEPRPLAGTDLGSTVGNIGMPFWSPDGRLIGFFGDGKLKRFDLDSSTVRVLADAPQPNGGAWAPDGTIIFSGRSPGGLSRIAATGGTPTMLTALSSGETMHSHPAFLPDGRHFLYWSRSATPSIWVGSLDSSERKRLFAADSRATYAAPGHLLFVRQGTLFAQQFDAAQREPLDEPVPIAEQVRMNAINGRAAFSASSSGVLVYRTGDANTGTPLSWYDRSGRLLETVRASAGAYQSFRLAGDEHRVVAHAINDPSGGDDLWTIDLERGVRTRITFDPNRDSWPVWSPDGAWIGFQSNRAGPGDLYRKRATGAGEDELLVKSDVAKIPTDWSAHWIVFTAAHSRRTADIWVLPLDGSARPEAYLQTDFSEAQGRLSPDERWMAYMSDETGESQVYVRPFPNASAAKWRISDADGGRLPVWRADGKELFYLSTADKLMTVPMRFTGAGVEPGAPHVLFQLPRAVGVGSYDMSGDGSRVIASTRLDETPSQQSAPLTVVLNWPKAVQK